MKIIEAVNLAHSYNYEGSQNRSLDDITLNVCQSQWIALLGHNGCGKTTFVKHINALLQVQNGELTVAGINAKNEANTWIIRKECGMVFQDPNNQFVSNVVEEDIAFGPENFDTPENEIRLRVKKALSIVGMSGFEKKSTHMLSGGQKQRIAIAGVLAVDPDIIVFDEATSMLDPEGRQEVLSTIQRLNHEEKKTIVMITHYIEEAVLADRVIVFKHGKLLGDGTPREVLSNLELLQNAGLMPPLPVRAYYDLKAVGVTLPICPITNQELVEALCQFR
jgi:energy-coupling factor transport system ATP-binding protein